MIIRINVILILLYTKQLGMSAAECVTIVSITLQVDSANSASLCFTEIHSRILRTLKCVSVSSFSKFILLILIGEC